MPTSITTINGTDVISTSRTTINSNFSSLNSNKIETDTLDTDNTLSANSDAKLATQKATKAYVDASVNPTGRSWNEYAVDAVGTDSYAITLTGVSAYVAGQTFKLKIATANTGACSLNINGLGAKTIKKEVSSDLTTGDLLANQIVMVTYDGTNFQLQSPQASLSALSNIRTNNATAGQSFTGATSPQAAFIADGSNSDTTLSYNQSDNTAIISNLGYSGIGGGTKVAKKVVVGSNPVLLLLLVARLSATGGGSNVNLTATVEADSAGFPSGVALATSDTKVVAGAAADITFTFPSAVELAASTTYWLVLSYAGSISGTGGEVIGASTGGGSTCAIYDAGAWSLNANYAQRIKTTMTYVAGNIYKTDTSLVTAKQVDGFVVNTVAKGDTNVQLVSCYGGAIIPGFSGLTLGGLYYCDGIGAISLTTTSTLIVGRAIATTTLFAAKTIT